VPYRRILALEVVAGDFEMVALELLLVGQNLVVAALYIPEEDLAYAVQVLLKTVVDLVPRQEVVLRC
jgi:hypothetical protein